MEDRNTEQEYVPPKCGTCPQEHTSSQSRREPHIAHNALTIREYLNSPLLRNEAATGISLHCQSDWGQGSCTLSCYLPVWEPSWTFHAVAHKTERQEASIWLEILYPQRYPTTCVNFTTVPSSHGKSHFRFYCSVDSLHLQYHLTLTFIR
jgi:hypothetical protein